MIFFCKEAHDERRRPRDREERKKLVPEPGRKKIRRENKINKKEKEKKRKMKMESRAVGPGRISFIEVEESILLAFLGSQGGTEDAAPLRATLLWFRLVASLRRSWEIRRFHWDLSLSPLPHSLPSSE